MVIRKFLKEDGSRWVAPFESRESFWKRLLLAYNESDAQREKAQSSCRYHQGKSKRTPLHSSKQKTQFTASLIAWPSLLQSTPMMEAALSLRDEGNWPPLCKTYANPPAQDTEHDSISVLFPKTVRPMRRRRKCKFRVPEIKDIYGTAPTTVLSLQELAKKFILAHPEQVHRATGDRAFHSLPRTRPTLWADMDRADSFDQLAHRNVLLLALLLDIPEASILNVYQHGSRVWGTAHPGSDWYALN